MGNHPKPSSSSPLTKFVSFKKAYFYEIVPSKIEEDQCRGNNIPFPMRRSLVEVRDIYPSPSTNPANPWRLRKTLSLPEVASGKIHLSHGQAFDYVFRYMTEDMTTFVLEGNKLPVSVWDLTDDKNPHLVCGWNMFFVKHLDESFLLGAVEVIQRRGINPGDEIGLYWDKASAAFCFKVLHRRV